MSNMLGDGFSDTDFSFDFDEAEKPKGLDPLPNGVYDVVITNAEVKPTNNGGKMVAVTYQVEGGDYDNRLVFENWVMPNRALQEPSKFKQSLGFLQVKLEAILNQPVTGSFKLNPMDLPGQRLKIQVGMERPQINQETQQPYPARNKVLKYISSTGQTFDATPGQHTEGGENGQPAQPAPTAPPEQPAATGAFRI